MNKFSRILIAASFSAALLCAQGRGPGGTPPTPAEMVAHRVDRLTTLLSLTDDQKARATTIFTDAATASTTARANSQTQRDALAAAVKKNDLAGIDQAATALGTISGQLTAIEAKADAAFYAILTPDQQAKYDQRGAGGPGRFGGPGGFGRRQ